MHKISICFHHFNKKKHTFFKHVFVIHILKASKHHFNWKNILQQENQFSVIKIQIVPFYKISDRILTGGNVETILNTINKIRINFLSDPRMASLQHFLFLKNTIKLVVLFKQKHHIYCRSQECSKGGRLHAIQNTSVRFFLASVCGDYAFVYTCKLTDSRQYK